MSTAVIILLSLLATIAMGYLFARITDPYNREQQQPSRPPNYPPYNPILFQPPPPAPERQPSAPSAWPLVILTGIAILIYLASEVVPAQNANRRALRSTSAVASQKGPVQIDYPPPTGPVYHLPETKDRAYTPPKPFVPPTSAPAPSQVEEDKPVDTYQDSSGRIGEAASGNSAVPGYNKGYGVQLFAQEKDWWEEGQARRVLDENPGRLLLAATGYTAGRTPVRKFILGAFNSKEEADRAALRLRKEFPGAFPVDLSKLGKVERYWLYP